MDIDTDDDILQKLAVGKSMDYEQWPALLSRLIPRLEKIVYNDFPIPQAPPTRAQPPSSSPPELSTAGESSTQSSTQSQQENVDPPSQPISEPDGALPPQLQYLLKSIISTLETLFSTHPPHTIQRLAELILSPKKHYRTLPSYLMALDRVVHVSSGAHIFPLPPAIPDPSSISVLSNGHSSVDPLSVAWSNTTTAALSLGSDESLGGALLTPISWLTKPSGGTKSPMEGEVKTESTEMIEGPNGLGGVETVSVSVNGISSATAASNASNAETDLSAALRAEGGITQGELLRQEQKAGVVPATQLRHGGGDSDGMGEDDEMPHARGPEEIGMEDMGPQSSSTGSERKGLGQGMQGIDIEAAIGRKLDLDEADTETETETETKSEDNSEEEEKTTPGTPKREAEQEIGGKGKRVKAEDADADTDMKVVDADGKTEDEPTTGEEGETKGVDAMDSSAV